MTSPALREVKRGGAGAEGVSEKAATSNEPPHPPENHGDEGDSERVSEKAATSQEASHADPQAPLEAPPSEKAATSHEPPHPPENHGDEGVSEKAATSHTPSPHALSDQELLEHKRALVRELEDRQMDASRAHWSEHFIELRRRLIAAAKALALCLIIAAVFHKTIYDIIAAPLYEILESMHLSAEIKFRSVNGPLYFYMRAVIIAAMIGGLPAMLYQLWLFIAPGLYAEEKRVVIPFVVSTSLFFFMGVAFSYFFVMPFAFEWSLGLAELEGPRKLVPDITLEDYFSTFTQLTFAVGIGFLSPVLIAFCSYVGLVTYETLMEKWRWATVIIFVVAALLTPPDYVTQVLLATPLMALYWLNVGFAYWLSRRARA